MRDDPPGTNRHERAELAPVEVDPEEFTERDEDGYRYPNPPDELPFDDAGCAECAAPIGFVLYESEDGRQAGCEFRTTFRTHDGRYLCEDCVMEEVS